MYIFSRIFYWSWNCYINLLLEKCSSCNSELYLLQMQLLGLGDIKMVEQELYIIFNKSFIKYPYNISHNILYL